MFNPPPIELVFWPYLGATQEFSGIFWLIGTGRPLRNFRTTATSDGSASCARNPRLTGFRGSGGLRQISRPRSGPETGQKHQKVDFPGLGGCSGRDARRPNLIAC